MKNRERRIYPLEGVEVRQNSDGSFRFEGYGAVFGSLSEDLGGFRELVGPSAFTKTLQEADVRSLINHDPNLVLGRNKAGTLRLSVDDRGLHVDNDLPNTSYARDLYESLQRGDVDQMSFAFSKVRDSWDESTSPPTRTLEEVRLHDVSVVTYPAYPETSAEARARAVLLDDKAWEIPGLDIDFRALTAVEQELRVGKVLSQKSKELLAAAMEAIERLLASAEPEQVAEEAPARATSSDAEEATTRPLSVLRKRLELIEAESK